MLTRIMPYQEEHENVELEESIILCQGPGASAVGVFLFLPGITPVVHNLGIQERDFSETDNKELFTLNEA